MRLALWICVGLLVAVPVVLAAQSPLLAWRDGVYIFAGFAGIAAMCLMLVQPMLIASARRGLLRRRSRSIHRFVGLALVLAVLAHVIGLWVTSPPDVIDALLFRSATSFSQWGVIAMWAVFAAAIIAAFKGRVPQRPWTTAHKAAALVIVIGTVLHVVPIDGTMEYWSKIALGLAATLATLRAVSLR